MQFFQPPNLLEGLDLDISQVTDPSNLGSVNEEDTTETVAEELQNITDGASDLIDSSDQSQASRGTPSSLSEVSTPISGNYLAGEHRIRALVEIFGQDALVLGHLLFQVPPLAIRIKKGNITYRWKPLRTKESIAVKSGNGECYIEIDLAFVGLSQIQNSLSELIALWKTVPFCFIENVHIRKMMIPERPDESMAVCLETLVMDAISGRPNTVFATLITRWFNYKPFSRNFWFRKEWKPADETGSTSQQTGDGGPFAETSNERTSDGDTVVPPDPTSTILVDLSAIQNPEILNVLARDLPPEVGLFESVQVNNPGDPTIHGTYPVVYPFNSQPFLDRVRRGNSGATRINSWGDSIEIKWNTFVRMNVPANWRYTFEREGQVSVAAERPRDRQTEASVPPPVTGERDTIVFLGDSISVGFLGITGREGTGQRDSGIPFFEFSGNSKFPSKSGFRFVAMCRTGASSATLRQWWNNKKNDPSLKASGNNEPCSRVAGVFVSSGTNDTSNGPNLSAIGDILSQASQLGAIPILTCLPPTNDYPATENSPVVLGQLRLSWGDSQFLAYQDRLPDTYNQLKALVEGYNGRFIDYHEDVVEPRFRGNKAPPLAKRYHGGVPRHPGYYNIHYNDAGYQAAGNLIHRLMPWNSLTGTQTTETTSELWTVCHVEDGDTCWVWGTHPTENRRVVRIVRLQYIDTPETYSEYSQSRYNSGGEAPLPHGQDSYRPAEMRYGAIATNALRGELTENSQVRIEWGGSDYYGRHLGVIFKGQTNVNLKMVEEGYAFASIPGNPSNELNEHETGFEYWRAEEMAKGAWPRERPTGSRRGIWNQQSAVLSGVPSNFPEDVRANLVTLMRPDRFRAVYGASDSGGHGSTPPENCNQGTVDQGDNSGGSTNQDS